MVVETLRMDLFTQDRVECRGWQMQAHRPNLASHLQIKIYWNIVMLVSLQIFYGCFCATLTEYNSCNINLIVYTVYNISYLTFKALLNFGA